MLRNGNSIVFMRLCIDAHRKTFYPMCGVQDVPIQRKYTGNTTEKSTAEIDSQVGCPAFDYYRPMDIRADLESTLSASRPKTADGPASCVNISYCPMHRCISATIHIPSNSIWYGLSHTLCSQCTIKHAYSVDEATGRFHHPFITHEQREMVCVGRGSGDCIVVLMNLVFTMIQIVCIG